MFLFNVRVYGLLINDKEQILLSDEEHEGFYITKFPGGGLEYGEGLIDCLKREFLEECNMEIDAPEHLYTTDFFEKSAFNESQIISVYYLVKPASDLDVRISDLPFDFDKGDKVRQAFRWKNLSELDPYDVTFLTEKKAIEALKKKLNKAV